MNSQPLNPQNHYDPWICPNIGTYWQLAKVRGSDRVVLKSRQGNGQFTFSPMEGFVLQHFTGKLAIAPSPPPRNPGPIAKLFFLLKHTGASKC
jgi:putative peptide zinc metalloprotease protein